MPPTPLIERLAVWLPSTPGAALAAALALVVGCLALKAAAFLLGVWRARRLYVRLQMPGPPPAKNVLLGHIEILGGPQGPWRVLELARKYGPVYKLQTVNTVSVVLTDPAEIGRVSRRTGPGPYCTKPREMYRALEKPIQPEIPNILTGEDGPMWKAVRQGIAPCFSASNLKKVLPLVLRLTERVADLIASKAAEAEEAEEAKKHDGSGNGNGNGKEEDKGQGQGQGGSVLWDVSDAAKRITSDVMGWMLLDEDLGGTRWQPSEYLQLVPWVLKAESELIENPFALHAVWRADVRAQRRVLKRHNELMDDKVAQLLAKPPPDYSIAAHLMRVRDPRGGRPLSRDQVKAELAIILAAGFETTSHAVTWVLATLAAHPETQDEVVAELRAAGLCDRPIEAGDLGRLPLLSAAIKEALRICAPAPWGGTKVAPVDMTLGGYAVPAGTMIMLPALPTCLSAANYNDPMLFKPARWMGSTSLGGAAGEGDDGEREAPAAAAAGGDGGASKGGSGGGGGGGGGGGAPPPEPTYFMVGPRDCVGQGLAKLELVVIVATLLARFRVAPGPALAAELQSAAALSLPIMSAVHSLAGTSITLQPLSGELHLRFTPRAKPQQPAAAA